MTSMDFARQVRELEEEWAKDARWSGVRRDYTAEDVVALRGSFRVDHTIARYLDLYTELSERAA